jgi:hypothetical protein
MSLRNYDVINFGAVNDGVTVNTQAFRNACLSCAEAGGGIVLVGAGSFVTGPFQIFSNTELRLEPGSQILASTHIDDYFTDYSSMESPRIGLIYARNAQNIAITGFGTIDFRGPAFMEMNTLTPWVDFDRHLTHQQDQYMQKIAGIGDGPVKVLDRPGNLIQFLGCQNVTLSQITLKNAPNWTIQIGDSQDVFVHAMRVLNNLLIANSDGIHCTSCRNVRISDCHIESGDDSIAITSLSQSGRNCENVTVSNCTLVSRSAGVRVGYGSGNIRNCLFQNLIINANRGISVFARNNKSISEICFEHLIINTRLHDGQWWGHAEPIHISAVRADSDIPAGTIRNISISHVMAQSESGIVIYASEEGCLEHIKLNDIQLSIKSGTLTPLYGGNFDLRPAALPQERLFQHPEGGFFALNTAYLTVQDLMLHWEGQPDPVFSYGLRTENCPAISLHGFDCHDTHVAENLRTMQLDSVGFLS